MQEMEDERQKAAGKKAPVLLPRQQEYASQSLREITEKLEQLSGWQKGGQLTAKICDIVYVLKTQRLRSAFDAHAFRTCGGLKALLRLLRVCEGKAAGLVLGTLGNVCALEGATRREVVQDATALDDIVGVLESSSSPDCLNTAARVVGNLALDEENIGLLRELGVVRKLYHILSSHSSNSGSKQSVLRSLRILSADSECREELKNVDSLLALAACLKSDDEAVVVAAVQVVAMLTRDGDPDTIQLLCTHGSMPHVVQLSEHRKTKVQREAVKVILQCCKNSEGRVALGSAGGVETLVGFLAKIQPQGELFNEITCALCMCCRDVISRQRLRDCGGLEHLIGMLSKLEFAAMHGNILSALVCYYFDENTLKYMVKRLQLLQALTRQLQEMTRKAVVQDSPAGMLEEVKGYTEEDEAVTMETESEMSVKLSGEDGSSNVSIPCESPPHGSPGPEPTHVDSECSSCGENMGLEEMDSLSAPPAEVPPRTEHLSTGSEPMQATCAEVDQLESFSLALPTTSESGAIPPSLPVKRTKLQFDLDTATPMPANFIDSLLSSPSPYQSPQSLSEASLLPRELAVTQEAQVILLLSRVSHLRDCLTNLSSQDILTHIIGYCFAQEYPNIHVFKLLTRVFMNPHCFQDCLLARVPSTIYSSLRVPDAPSSHEEQPSGTTSPAWSLGGRQDSSSSCNSPVLFSPVVRHPAVPFSLHMASTVHTFYGMSWELLERLSKVAESPYGQGVLAHMLLRGEEREKQASCLAIPILCRSARVCQKLMQSYKGLDLLTALVTSTEEANSELQILAIDSFIKLASNLDNAGLKRKRSISDDATSLVPPTKCARTEQHTTEGSADSMVSGPICETPFPSTNTKKFSCCHYQDSDHHPFDLILRVSSGSASTRLPVHRQVLRESSDVFSVMLGGQYKESAQAEVDIRDVPSTAMLSIVHHLYGCGWLCPSVLEEVMEPREGDCRDEGLASALTEEIIEETVATFDFHEDRELARHSLQVLAIASRFLLPDLCAHCELYAASYITPRNVVPAFHYAQLHQSCYLAQKCIRQVVGMSHSQLRCEVFKDLITSPEGAEAMRLFQAFVITRFS